MKTPMKTPMKIVKNLSHTLLALTVTAGIVSCGGSSSGTGSFILPKPNPNGTDTRSIPALECNTPKLIQQPSTLIFPSIDIISIPAGIGTLRVEWDAFDAPDRFELEFFTRGRIKLDSGYVGGLDSDSSTVPLRHVNSVLTANGQPAITEIIAPGSGSTEFADMVGMASGFLRVYTPSPIATWNVMLTWICPEST